jgi:hypothetical protein
VVPLVALQRKAGVAALLAAHDFSSARAHLVASVPGSHEGRDLHAYGHLRVRELLSQVRQMSRQFAGTLFV